MGQLSVNLVWNGKCAINGVDNVGTVAASLATYLAIQAINPDIVISAGTAGGFKSQVAHGGRVVAHGVREGGREASGHWCHREGGREDVCSCTGRQHPVCPQATHYRTSYRVMRRGFALSA